MYAKNKFQWQILKLQEIIKMKTNKLRFIIIQILRISFIEVSQNANTYFKINNNKKKVMYAYVLRDAL